MTGIKKKSLVIYVYERRRGDGEGGEDKQEIKKRNY